MKDLLEERRSVKQLSATTLNCAKYKKLKKPVMNNAKEDEDRLTSGVASDFERTASLSNQREVWANIRVLSRKSKKQTSTVRDKEGNFIADQENQ